MGFSYKKNIGKGYQMKHGNSAFRMETLNEGELITFESQKMSGGSPAGMFAIPMGIFHRINDAKQERAKQEIQQNKIKFGDFGENIQKYKTDPNFTVFPNENNVDERSIVIKK